MTIAGMVIPEDELATIQREAEEPYEPTDEDWADYCKACTCTVCNRCADSPMDITDSKICARCMETRYNDLKRLCDALVVKNNDLRNALGTASWIQGKLEEKGAYGQGFEEWDEINAVLEASK